MKILRNIGDRINDQLQKRLNEIKEQRIKAGEESKSWRNRELTRNELETFRNLKKKANKLKIPITKSPVKNGRIVYYDYEPLTEIRENLKGQPGSMPFNKGKATATDVKNSSIRKQIKTIQKSKGREIQLASKDPATLAHELGHAEKPKLSITKLSSWGRKKIHSREKGVIPTIKAAIGYVPFIQEEKRATKEGLRLLKESGANTETLKTAENALKDYLKTHQLGSKFRIIKKLIRK